MKPGILAACMVMLNVSWAQAHEGKTEQKIAAAMCIIDAEWPLIEEVSLNTRLSKSYMSEVVGIILRDVENPKEMIESYNKVAQDFPDDSSGPSAARRAECLLPLVTQ